MGPHTEVDVDTDSGGLTEPRGQSMLTLSKRQLETAPTITDTQATTGVS
jgi:hypothetical protein